MAKSREDGISEKGELDDILLKADWQRLGSWAAHDRQVIRQLQSRVIAAEGLLFWRTVEGLGRVAKWLEQEKPGYASELVKRYFWLLNEESGGTAWNAGQAIGSIMANCPETCGHFHWMLADLLDDPSLRNGVLWSLLQVTLNAPEWVFPLEERVRPFLGAEQAETRTLAALLYYFVPKAGSAGEGWKLSREIRERLAGDKTPVTLYQEGRLRCAPVHTWLQADSVCFWSQGIDMGWGEANVTVASSGQGLCWVNSGDRGEEEERLRTWVRRHFPGHWLARALRPNHQVLKELTEYFQGVRREFSPQLHLAGTEFQQKVWQALTGIPFGETRSYLDIATSVGLPKGSRAVGGAIHNNPVSFIVPCHRVIGKNGSLTGYAGGLALKAALLELEKGL